MDLSAKSVREDLFTFRNHLSKITGIAVASDPRHPINRAITVIDSLAPAEVMRMALQDAAASLGHAAVVMREAGDHEGADQLTKDADVALRAARYGVVSEPRMSLTDAQLILLASECGGMVVDHKDQGHVVTLRLPELRRVIERALAMQAGASSS